MSAKELADLRLAEDLTSAQPAKLAKIVAIVGKVLLKLSGKTLCLILDELDRLYYVGEETGSTFGDAFRKLFGSEQRTVALLMGCSAENLKSLPEVFGGERGPVLSRLSPNDRIEITQLDPADVDEFISQVVAFVRDKNADIKAMSTRAAASTSEKITERFFPFSDDAKDALVGALKQKMTPREITQRMTHAAGKAYLNRSLAILKDHVA
ncbi:MAG: hypothetical protein FJY85_15365 [Deltaproteobacteria bacterium]|nr:hypothetical protein [Deltaproteobacteria bacterium]